MTAAIVAVLRLGRVPLPTLQGERLTLRPPRAADATALADVLAEPEVAGWWGAWDRARVRRELVDPGGGFAIVIGDAVRGWLACEEEPDPDYRHVALDIFLAASLHGQGYGREALRVAIRHFVARGHHRFTIDPAANNERAIRAYAAVGFKPVGVMRSYERGRDGSWHDNLLMDLLAGELDG